jgi:hypothetical protein
LITLTFRCLRGEGTTLARGAYFRICADATLRGPDNSVAARYSGHSWRLGHQDYSQFECTGPIYLRVTDREARCEHIGPYEFIRAAEGALFSRQGCLGTHAPRVGMEGSALFWTEIALLSHDDSSLQGSSGFTRA